MQNLSETAQAQEFLSVYSARGAERHATRPKRETSTLRGPGSDPDSDPEWKGAKGRSD